MGKKDTEGNQKAEQENITSSVNENNRESSIGTSEDRPGDKSKSTNGSDLEEILDLDHVPP